jgi:hypothetical protein
MVGGLVGKRRSVSLQEKKGCYMVMYFVYFGYRELPRLYYARGTWCMDVIQGVRFSLVFFQELAYLCILYLNEVRPKIAFVPSGPACSFGDAWLLYRLCRDDSRLNGSWFFCCSTLFGERVRN